MRIALVIQHGNEARGGAERYTLSLARMLVHNGEEVHLLAETFGATPEGVERERLVCGAVTRRGRWQRFLDAVEDRLSGGSYDVIHAMVPVRWCNIYQPHAGFALETFEKGYLKYEGAVRRLVSRLSTRLNRKRRLVARIEKRLLAGANGPEVVCFSEAMLREAKRLYPGRKEGWCVLPNGIDLSHFDPGARSWEGEKVRAKLGIGPEQIVALTVAQDFKRKGVGEAIRAIAEVGEDRLVLVVAGRDEPEPYERLAESLGLGRRVHFVGSVEDTYGYYQAGDLLVFPSHWDAFGLVVPEAMAMGLPVIVSGAAGASELVRDGVEGRVLEDASNVGELAGLIREMLDPETRRRMSQACLEARERLSQERHFDRVMEIYERQARRGEGPMRTR